MALPPAASKDGNPGRGRLYSFPLGAREPDAKRDEHIRTQDWLDEASHPHITFRSTSLERYGDS